MAAKINEDWDFTNADIHYMTHGLHIYPARMIPQIARRLIERYSCVGDIVLDPFCGSGGVLVESMLTGRNAVGIDINPLACLLARVKSTPLNPKLLVDVWTDVRKNIGQDIGLLRLKQIQVKTPEFSGVNISYWFKPYMIEELAVIKNHLDKIPRREIREFFYVCFSNTVRTVSGTRKGEFKLYRMPLETWKNYSPNVLKIFEERVNNAISKMGEFYEYISKNGLKTKSEVYVGDTSKIFTDEFPSDAGKRLKEESVNLIVTSPPYGDSHTTVAYGQFSRYPLIWLGYPKEKVLEIDKISLGGRRNGEDLNLKSLNRVIDKIQDEKRAEEVKYFFIDLSKCLDKLSKLLAAKAYACFVLGNRTVNTIKIPTDEVITEIGKEFGLERETVIYRRIPSKRIPWKSSPTNIAGQKVETISKENIVILRKR